MSLPGSPKCEYRSAQHEGNPVNMHPAPRARGASPGRPATLAIVVIPLLGGDALNRTLRSIQAISAPCFVVGGHAPPPHSGKGAAPIFIASDLPVPERRAIGVAVSATEWVALIEDTCDVGAGWLSACAEIAGADDVAAAGGPVTIVPSLPPRCMALACLEYAAYAPTGNDHGKAPEVMTTHRLAGLALLYRRSSLPPLGAGKGLIESEVNEDIRIQGGRLLMHPGLAVEYRSADGDSATLASRFSHGRIYGGGQRARLGLLQRGLGALKCIALPVVMHGRAMRGLPAACRSRQATRIWILALSVAWSAGELVGVLAGRGSSLARWK